MISACGSLTGHAEYIGELIRESTAEGREVLAAHRGRNYLFQLNEEYTIDATFVGNETRYINHAPGRAANCVAQSNSLHPCYGLTLNFLLVLLVNGEHRIGFWACRYPSNLDSGIYLTKHTARDIKPGEEVLLDYGKDFFQDTLHASQLTAKVASLHRGGIA